MIAVELPTAGDTLAAEPGTLNWLLAGMRPGQPFATDAVRLRATPGDAIGITLAADTGSRVEIAIPLAAGASADADVEVAPRLTIKATASEAAATFLHDHWRALDHVGINLSHRDVSGADWDRMIARIAAAAPAYRLDVASDNDIVLIVEEAEAGGGAVLELVHDRSAPRSSIHVCTAVAAGRAEVERAFPAPFGAYKPGDEAYFRSVALRSSFGIAAYLDLAFSDGGMTPWPQIVAAMGRRIG